MKLSMDSEDCVVSSNTFQINRVNTASQYMSRLIAKLSTWFIPIFIRELELMHRDCQSQPKLFWIWFRQFREQAETLPLTIITHHFLLAKELKSRKLTLVGMMKKNKGIIPPRFLAKADEGTVQNAFDHSNNFTLLSFAPKKNKKVVFLSTMHSEKRETRILEKKK